MNNKVKELISLTIFLLTTNNLIADKISIPAIHGKIALQSEFYTNGDYRLETFLYDMINQIKIKRMEGVKMYYAPG